MVDLGCVQIPQYLGSCDVFPKLHGGPKNVEILHIELWPTKSPVPRVINLGAHSAKVELCARASIRLACFAGTCQILVSAILWTAEGPYVSNPDLAICIYRV